MSHHAWKRGIALAASVAILAALPGAANAAESTPDPTGASTLGNTTLSVKGKLTNSLLGSNGRVTAFIETQGVAGLQQQLDTRARLNQQRSALSDDAKDAQAADAAKTSAAQADQTANGVFDELKKLDPSAQSLYTTPYVLPGVAVNADAAALRRLAQENGQVLRVSLITPKTSVSTSTADTTNAEAAKLAQQLKDAQAKAGDEAPANYNSDPLVGAVNTWTATGNTGKGVNIAVIDTGLDYTHADFGGAGTEEAYQKALAKANDTDNAPETDPELSALLDTNKYKGGIDLAGATYGSKDANGNIDSNPVPDLNPIDGKGGHHGTHVSGTAAGYGVTKDGKTFRGDYTKLTASDVADLEVGPGSAPDAGIYAIKVFSDNGGTTGLVLDALNYVAQINATASAADKVSIVSMSLGGSFGAPDDPENKAVDQLTKAGILSVVAAGNDDDITDIAGAPGTAKSALTVAASQSGKTLQDAIEVVDGPDSLKGQKLAGQYSQNYAKLDDFSVTGKVVRVKETSNLEGCKPYSAEDAAAVKGNIAYVEWYDEAVNCGSGARFNYAEQAGAIGVLFASQKNIPEAGIAGNQGIPGLQLVKNAAENQDLQNAIDAGTLTVRLGSDLRLSLNADYSKENADTIASFTSRGNHGSYDGTVKPDVAAPGVGIVSASAGTGAKPEVMSGTSMATPLTSGVSALVRAAHPDWSPEQIKAQVVNTADHDVLTEDRTIAYSPLRVGTGRIDALAAVNDNVQVYAADDALAVTGQFGVVQVPAKGYEATKTFTVKNTGKETRTYKVSYDARTTVSGVDYKLSTDTVTVKPRSTATFDVTLSIPDQSKLRHDRDATQSAAAGGLARSWVSDASGVVKLTPADNIDSYGLRVAVSSAPKPVSETAASFVETDTNAKGLKLTGNGLAQGDGETAYNSKAYPLIYSTTDPVDVAYGEDQYAANRSLAAADIRAIGYSSTAHQFADPTQGKLNFGIVTDKSWSKLGEAVTPEIWISTGLNEETPSDEPNYVILVETAQGGITQTDTAWATTYKLKKTAAGYALGDAVDTQPIDDVFIHDSNQVVLSVKISALGLGGTDEYGNLKGIVQYMAQTESNFSTGSSTVVDQAGGDRSTLSNAFYNDFTFGADGIAGANGKGEQISFPDVDGSVIPVQKYQGLFLLGEGKTLTLHANAAVPEKATDTLGDLDIDSYDANTASLKDLVERYSTLKQDDYTSATWTPFAAALKAAQDVLANPNATQDEVDKAYNDLQKAYDELHFKATENGKAKLAAEVQAAESLNADDYTAESWQAFQDALNAAKAVLTNPDVSQDDVDAALSTLQAARGALKPAPAPNPNPGDGDGNGNANAGDTAGGAADNAGNAGNAGNGAADADAGADANAADKGGQKLANTGSAVAGIVLAAVTIAAAGAAALAARRRA